MWHRVLAELITASTLAIGRAIGKAFREEYTETAQAWKSIQHQSRREAAEDAETKSVSARTGITIAEAAQILNLKEPYTFESIENNFRYLFEVNSKEQGASKYIQAKVTNAKERLIEELQSKKDKTDS
ncbi:mitochondrial import inner membrane translocase subunit Tim16-like [Symsagittifera roscoffensis]|uniref:mitochondrial import inner membrane translocase subunit Tim16-like n=1 Tax=Symsagittifera roscoffensis TaxID=84072 RepID=UPI00307BE572